MVDHLRSILLRLKTAAYEGAELYSFPLTKGKATGTAINAAQTLSTDVGTSGFNELTVNYRMTGTALGDLTVRVGVFLADGVTVSNIGLPPIRSTGPLLNAGVVEFTATYDVSGIDKVRIFATNSNVGAQTIQDSNWKLS